MSQQYAIDLTRKKVLPVAPTPGTGATLLLVLTHCDLFDHHPKPCRAHSALLAEKRTIRADIPPTFELHLEAVCNLVAEIDCTFCFPGVY